MAAFSGGTRRLLPVRANCPYFDCRWEKTAKPAYQMDSTDQLSSYYMLIGDDTISALKLHIEMRENTRLRKMGKAPTQSSSHRPVRHCVPSMRNVFDLPGWKNSRPFSARLLGLVVGTLRSTPVRLKEFRGGGFGGPTVT